MKELAEQFHEKLIAGRRIKIFADTLQDLIPPNAHVLDVGCGDGRISAEILARRRDIQIMGVDVVPRKQFYIPATIYDGKTIPFENNQFGTVILIDVLHHSKDALGLMQECLRVSSAGIIIKDHLLQGFMARRTLSLMDKIGNSRFNVNLECTYLTRDQWQDLFSSCSLDVRVWNERLGIYPWPLSVLFERNLHFLVYLRKAVDYT